MPHGNSSVMANLAEEHLLASPICCQNKPCEAPATHEIKPGSLEDYYTSEPRYLCGPCHTAFKLGQAWSGVRTEEL